MTPDIRPLISIVTPVFNGSKYLEEMIESARSQTYPNIEHVIIDDGSTDGGRTVGILKRYPHLRWWTRPNQGQYATQNEGFHAANGEWITCNGQDDRYSDRTAIEGAVDHILSHPGIDAVHGLTRHIDASGEPLPIQPPQRFPYWTLPYCLTFSHCSLFVRSRSLVEKNLYFDASLRYTGDADWIFRLHSTGMRFSRLERLVSDYRHHPDQMTSVADVEDIASKNRMEEEDRLVQTYARNKWMRLLVLNWVTFEKRRRKAVAYAHGYRKQNGVWVKRG
ncbi:MAG: glycosyltransferase family 2 protein [Fimbriimonas sp.]|nr:glycosyltransferase family 2 protein [Fimbriimonas sp.]